jgi:hypothetical protein
VLHLGRHLDGRRLLAASVAGTEPSGRDRRHLADCKRCQAVRRAHLDVEHALSGTWGLLPVASTGSFRRAPQVIAIQAVAATVLIVGLLLFREIPGKTPYSKAPAGQTGSPPSTAVARAAPEHGVTGEAIGPVAWSGDGDHLLVNTGADAFVIVSGSGDVIGRFSATSAGWLTNDSVAAWSTLAGDPTQGHLRVVSINGGTKVTLGGSYGPPTYSVSGSAVGLPNLKPSVEDGPSFRVWADGRLSASRPGIPVAFDAVASHLLVVRPGNRVARGSGVMGHPIIETTNGTTIAESELWTSSTTVATFSPDGTQLATCAAVDIEAQCTIVVLSIPSGTVVDTRLHADLLTWADQNSLVLTGSTAPPTEWKSGVARALPLPSGMYAMAQGNRLALWSSAETSIRVVVAEGQGMDRTVFTGDLVGRVPAWSPDGTKLAVAVWQSPKINGQRLLILSP